MGSCCLTLVYGYGKLSEDIAAGDGGGDDGDEYGLNMT